jgi:beta-1,2-mannobiose phosphorylase / 1,2-beta-oligomannan phosphorylase
MANSFLYLKRYAGNPIIEAEPRHRWESSQTFNPGTILLEGKVHILYRAIGEDGISRFGYASSDDGEKVNERLEYPVFEHPISEPVFNLYSVSSGGGFGGAEDPRIVHVIGDDVLYLTYTACDVGIRMALTSITIEDFFRKKWNWAQPTFISPLGQVHKNWVIFPEKINGKYAILHNLNPQLMISYHDSLDLQSGVYFNNYISERPTSYMDSRGTIIRGAGAPPIKTPKGWLVFYHVMTPNDYGKYKVGAMLLDLKDPSIITYRSSSSVLEPSEVYENSGFKPGVVYLSGAVVKGTKLLVYYGASDSYVCVASCELDEILEDMVDVNTKNT